MTTQTRHTYHDFEDRTRIRYTLGKFHQWQRGGVLNAWGAVFLNRSSAVFIPEYLLTAETKTRIPAKPMPDAPLYHTDDGTLVTIPEE